MTRCACREAYLAAFDDFTTAERNYKTASKDGNVGDKSDFIKKELVYLWERRIERGELPPIEFATGGNVNYPGAR